MLGDCAGDEDLFDSEQECSLACMWNTFNWKFAKQLFF